ncbi:MAG: methylated-DNA--[protein]-cysteine S-methyltransferase [candidate division WOR-3 bacterium]|jgi:methylated-DNA-[protein]-cysteine S-methyltransferase
MKNFVYYKSPIGFILIEENDGVITKLDFVNKKKVKKNTHKSELLKKVLEQLDQYFKKKRKNFSIKVLFSGTEFQKKVLKTICKIPYGKTATYSDIAKLVGNPKAVRAVGNALRQNNVPIIIPCHRIIGKDGGLRGFAGKIKVKEFLLKLENPDFKI